MLPPIEGQLVAEQIEADPDAFGQDFADPLDGIEVKMRDQDGALLNVARYLGMMVERREVTGANGGPIKHQESAPAADLTPEELAAELARYGIDAAKPPAA